MPDPGQRRTRRPTPTIVLRRLRRSAGECPACKAKLTGVKDVDGGERASYACGSHWIWFGRPGTAKAGKVEVSCSKQPVEDE